MAINNFQSKGSVSLCQKSLTVLFGLGCEIISLYVKMFKFIVVSDHHFHLVSSIVCTQPYSFFFPFSASFPWEKVSCDYFAMQPILTFMELHHKGKQYFKCLRHCHKKSNEVIF